MADRQNAWKRHIELRMINRALMARAYDEAAVLRAWPPYYVFGMLRDVSAN